jgi:intracellular multiplication protein IcmE
MSNTDKPDDSFDTLDEFDQADKAGDDFGEFDDNQGSSEKIDFKKSPVFKFGVVALVILAVIGIVSFFGGETIDTPTSIVAEGDDQFKEAPGTKEVTPVMKQALEEKNEQRIEEAAKFGTSAIPTPIEPPKTLLEVTAEESQSEDPLLRWQQMQSERARVQREQQIIQQQQAQGDPQRIERINNFAAAMSSQIQGIMGEKQEAKMQNMTVTDVAALLGGEGQGGVGGGFAGSGPMAGPNGMIGAAPSKPVTVIIPAAKIEYAQMLIQANSDIPGPVIALLASGPFSGSKLLGQFTKEEKYLLITFSTLITKKGTSIPINAVAVDPNTNLTGIATDVDNRYLQRLIIPAAAKFVEGYGSALAQTLSTTSLNATTTVTTEPEPDAKEELGKGLEEAAKTASEIIEEDADDIEPLITVAAGAPLGILFMQPVTDQTVLMARSGMGGSANPQGMQGQQPQGMMPFNIQGGQQSGFMPYQQGVANNPMQLLQSGLQNQQFMQQGGQMMGMPSYPQQTNMQQGQSVSNSQ